MAKHTLKSTGAKGKRTEKTLRDSDAVQAFLLSLNDALRPLRDAEEIKFTAATLLGRRLAASRVAYAENVEDDQSFIVSRNYVHDAPNMEGRYRYADYGSDIVAQLSAGRNRVQPDLRNEERLTDAERRAFADAGIGASLNVPLVKERRLVAFLCVNYATAHDFTAAEIELVEAVAERTWAAVERARVEIALRESEARYRALVENVRDYAIFLLDAAGVITEWTPGAEAMTGYTPEEVAGRHFALLYTRDDAAAGIPNQQLAEIGAAGRGEWEGWRVRKDGRRFLANEIGTVVRDSQGRLIGFAKIARDVTQQRVAADVAEERRVVDARDELRRALLAAEEAERRRLARDLHDQLGQHLTAFSLGLADVRRRITVGDSTAARLDELDALARLMTRDARNLALELRPPELDDLGLASALDTYVREWGERQRIVVDLAVIGAIDAQVSSEVATTLYRIVREALTNVGKHAGATQVSVILDRPNADEVRLIVEDNGRGFDTDAAVARLRAERRLGLAGMRERAALVGGLLIVESSLGVGTTLQVRIPVGSPNARSS